MPWVFPVSYLASILTGKLVFAYARINTDLATSDIDTSEPNRAGLHRKSGYEERAEGHVEITERCYGPVGVES